MFTINCTRQAKTPEDLEMVYQHMKGLMNWYNEHSAVGFDFSMEPSVFYSTIIDTADKNRMVHLYQPMEIYGQVSSDLVADIVTE